MNKLRELLDYFMHYFDFSGATEWEIGFRCGAFFAIATILFLVVLILLLRFIFFRKRQIRQIELNGAKGKYIVSSAAISDLLSARISEVSEISLLKIKIFPSRHKKCQVVLYINYLPMEGAGNVKDLVSELQTATIAALSEVFGITAVESVSVRVARAKG